MISKYGKLWGDRKDYLYKKKIILDDLKKFYKIKDVKYDIIHLLNDDLTNFITNLYPSIPNISITELDDVDYIIKDNQWCV